MKHLFSIILVYFLIQEVLKLLKNNLKSDIQRVKGLYPEIIVPFSEKQNFGSII